METNGGEIMDTDIILRQPSLMLAKFEDGMRLVNMRNTISNTYNYAKLTKDMLIVNGIITLSEEKNKYKITDKGKEIKEHLKVILEKLK